MNRRGFSIAELVVAMVVMAVLGVALVSVMMSHSRFVSNQEAMMEARGTARAAMQSMLAELHMVGDKGLMAASRDSVRVRLPYAFGMACRTSSGVTVATLMPGDSLMYATAAVEGMAWRDPSSGAFTDPSLITGISVAASTNTAACTADSIRQIPKSSLIAITGIPGVNVPASGSLLYLYQTVTYKFAASSDVPGRRGLWRRVGTGVAEELASPFDTSAVFAFLMGPSMTVDSRATFSSAAALDSVRGLQLRLYGASVSPPQGRSAPQMFPLRTRVAFMNCRGARTCTQP